jgi:ferric-dicitrate binding protein FerR (iron transport regulator)
VALELDGLGTVGGTQQAPEIRWESGTLRVAVTPDRDVRLAVVTPEATVRVVGTEFSVDRADFATAVRVSHGTVEVTCTGGEPARVSAPGMRRCLPSDPATLLRRVTALRRNHAGADERLEAIDAGLATPATHRELTAELLAHRADLLASIGRDGDAMDAASAYLRIGGPRQVEMIELLVALGEGRCDVLEQVVAADPAGPWQERLAECVRARPR